MHSINIMLERSKFFGLRFVEIIRSEEYPISALLHGVNGILKGIGGTTNRDLYRGFYFTDAVCLVATLIVLRLIKAKVNAYAVHAHCFTFLGTLRQFCNRNAEQVSQYFNAAIFTSTEGLESTKVIVHDGNSCVFCTSFLCVDKVRIASILRLEISHHRSVTGDFLELGNCLICSLIRV